MAARLLSLRLSDKVVQEGRRAKCYQYEAKGHAIVCKGAGALADATFGSSEGGLGLTLALQRDLASSAAGK